LAIVEVFRGFVIGPPPLFSALRLDRAYRTPTGSKDAAVVITLNPGAYTAQIKSAKNASSGVALIEIYEVP